MTEHYTPSDNLLKYYTLIEESMPRCKCFDKVEDPRLGMTKSCNLCGILARRIPAYLHHNTQSTTTKKKLP